jgi:hypothetical protein
MSLVAVLPKHLQFGLPQSGKALRTGVGGRGGILFGAPGQDGVPFTT